MLRLEDTKREGAIERAKELHPNVRMQEFGIYPVTVTMLPATIRLIAHIGESALA